MSLHLVKEKMKKYDNIVILVPKGKADLEGLVSKGLKKSAAELLKKNKFDGSLDQKICMTDSDGSATNIVLKGLGNKKDLTKDKLKTAIYTAIKDLKGDTFVTSKEKDLLDIDILGDVAEHVNYSFDKYKHTKSDKKTEIYISENAKIPSVIEGVELGKITNIVRDLVNEPANVMTPVELSKIASSLGKKYGFDVNILDEGKIEKLKMGAFFAVAKGSENPPRFIIMKYNGDKRSKLSVGLVGKGLCYDAGGLSLKPTDSMFTMKSDMTGAATVIGVMCAAAKMKLKKNITAVIAACENVISGKSYKPGDVITAMSGTTIEVTNTDAEGRMTLADALTYIIQKEKVSEVIDVATLTGAIMIALGEEITGVFTNANKNYDALVKAGEKWGERYWNMPMSDEFKDMIKADIADIKNSAGRWGGSSTAAKFLEEFVEGTPWMHLDIAGTSYSDKNGRYYQKGATGEVVKSLYTYIKDKK